MAVPVLENILRQHAEMPAFLWTAYDRARLFPEENPEMDEVRIARLLERLEAHLDGLRVAGADGTRIAEGRFAEYPEAGELFVLRMLASRSAPAIRDLERLTGADAAGYAGLEDGVDYHWGALLKAAGLAPLPAVGAELVPMTRTAWSGRSTAALGIPSIKSGSGSSSASFRSSLRSPFAPVSRSGSSSPATFSS